ncbi:Transporter, sodium/sulfate symporter family [hydrothermal vent metagenome]|uniref:Transporter, sodium/sulfate symporter family n=1 Tax=hydrothermal vent metagenome TaxID=652676 RepID=A0A3B0TYW5_9ZZZZ
MTLEGYIVCGVIGLMIVALAKEVMRPGLVLFSAVTILMAFGIIDANESVAGFSNKGMITIALLFLVSEGVRQTGALNRVAQAFLPKKRGRMTFLLPRIMIPVSALSAFLNNTPVVIIFAPMIKKWAEKLNLSSQKFLIPLSYATIFGGICTLIGTSTNLVVHGLMLDNGLPGFGMFELGRVGIFIAILGFIYMSIFGNMLLPGKKIKLTTRGVDFKEYYYDLIIPKNSNLIGKTIVNGRLAELKNLWVYSIDRGGEAIDTAKGEHTIQANDKIVVAGKSDSLEYILSLDSVELQGLDLVKGLIPTSELKQYEAVLSPRFPGIGSTIVDFNFFDHYQAAVIAVHRDGERITSNVRNLVLKDGDNLVLLTNERFIKNWGESKIFYLTSYIGEHKDLGKNWKKWSAFIILVLMIVGATIGNREFFPSSRKVTFDMFYFAAIAAILMVWLKIMPHQKYTKVISWDILITIASAFALSKAMQNSGAADALARTTINFARSWGPVGVLAAIYLITTIFTEIITNNAAAALVFPIALSAATQLGVNPQPFFVAIAIAASASFSTPIGYQTNLIVQGIGNYRFRDYIKIGWPLNLIAFIVSVILIPIFWSF